MEKTQALSPADSWEAKKAARASMAAALQAANPKLVPAGTNALVAAAKNIRIELARAFPGVKFKVVTERFSMGDAIRVRWTDGPTADQVEQFTDRYVSGTFDAMTDCSGIVSSAWMDAFGDAKFITCSRDYSDFAIASCTRTVAKRYGAEMIEARVPVPTPAEFRSGRLWAVRVTSGCDGNLQSLINRELNRRTWALTRAQVAA